MEKENIENITEEKFQPQSTKTLPIKKKKLWLMIVLIVLFFISLGITVFFAYQNYLLKIQLQVKEKEDILVAKPTIPSNPEAKNLEVAQNYFSYAHNFYEVSPETKSLKIAEEEIYNWKTFNNKEDNFNQKYKYEIKYPENFDYPYRANTGEPIIAEHEIRLTKVIEAKFGPSFGGEMQRPGLYLEFFDSKGYSLINWLKEIWGPYQIKILLLSNLDNFNNIVDKEREELTINSFQAIKILPNKYKSDFIFIYNGKDKIMKARCDGSELGIGNISEICNKMLSTFKFLN